MKLIAVILLALTTCAAQTEVIEPEFPDVFYALDAAGKLMPLERQEVSSHTKLTSPLSAKGSLELAGSSSPVRFRAGQPLTLIVKSPASLGADPEALYHIRKLEVKKKNRNIPLVKASILGAKITSEGLIHGDFSRYGSSSLRLVISVPDPGEYAVGRQGGQTVFCFGVD